MNFKAAQKVNPQGRAGDKKWYHRNPSATHRNHSAAHLNHSVAHLNHSAIRLNPSATHLNHSVAHLNRSAAHLNASATHLNRPVTHLNRPAIHLNHSATHLNPSVAHLNPSATHLNPSATHLNPSAAHLNPSVTHLNRSVTHLNRSATHRNHSSTHLNRPAAHLNRSATHLNHSAAHLNRSAVHLNATVEFYNKGYDCNCGIYQQKWQYFGIPVTSASVFPSSNLNPPSGTVTVNEWKETENGNKWVNVQTGNPMIAFRGYEITNSSTFLPTDIYSFTGTLLTGDQTVSLTKTDNVNYSGMNLIGNSFTAAIPINKDALVFNPLLAATEPEQTVYLFNTGTRDEWRKLSGSSITGTEGGRYLAVPFNLSGQSGLPSTIPSMHTFMVKANTATTLTLKYNLLQKNELISTNMAWRSSTDVARNVSTAPYPGLIIDVIGTRSADRVWLFENPTTTQGFDNGWDGTKMLETGIAQLYVSGTNNHKFQVATVPQIAGTTFGFTAETDGNYMLSFALSDDVAARTLYIRDTKTGLTHKVNGNIEVPFFANQGDNGNRFVLVTEENIIDKLGLVNAFARDRVISVVNDTEENCLVQVFDVSGRMVLQQNIQLKSFTNLQRQLPQGVYIVKITGETVNETKRVLVE